MANVIGLSDEHEANLKKLAAYLLSGELKAEFDMGKYDEDGTFGGRVATCGSVGCAIGHGPFVVPKDDGQTWCKYSQDNFGLRSGNDEWDWCFSNEWGAVDNTPEGAARRILWLLEHGLPDDNLAQMTGKAPLCYEQATA